MESFVEQVNGTRAEIVRDKIQKELVMNVEEFAEKYRVKVKRDECGERVTAGKGRSNIFDGYEDGEFGVCLMFESARKWGFARRKMEALAFKIRQDGDTEGIATFDPTDRKQAALAIRLGGARRKRSVTASQRQAMSERLAEARKALKLAVVTEEPLLGAILASRESASQSDPTPV
jgi:hypothetical protein